MKVEDLADEIDSVLTKHLDAEDVFLANDTTIFVRTEDGSEFYVLVNKIK